MTPNNIEKEYKELNTKNEWPALYQVFISCSHSSKFVENSIN